MSIRDRSPTLRSRAGSLVVLQGELDLSAVPELSQTMAAAIGSGDAEVVVDMSEVEFIDAAAIGVILRAELFLRRRSRILAVRAPSRCVLRILDLCGGARLIESPTERPAPGLADALATWVAVPATTSSAPESGGEAEPIELSVSALLRTFDTSTPA